MSNKKVTNSILLADDEENILDMYSHALAQVEYKVIRAANGREVVEILSKHKKKIVDLILLDIIMPEMDGFDALAKIRKNKIYVNTPVIMLTNLNRNEDINEAKKLGASDFLVKVKNSPSDLIKKVNLILKK